MLHVKQLLKRSNYSQKITNIILIVHSLNASYNMNVHRLNTAYENDN